MVFESGKKNITYYRTPYGTMLIGLDTNSILVSEKENEIQIEVNYGMDVNYEFLADCHIRISVCPVESVDFKLVD